MQGRKIDGSWEGFTLATADQSVPCKERRLVSCLVLASIFRRTSVINMASRIISLHLSSPRERRGKQTNERCLQPGDPLIHILGCRTCLSLSVTQHESDELEDVSRGDQTNKKLRISGAYLRLPSCSLSRGNAG